MDVTQGKQVGPSGMETSNRSSRVLSHWVSDGPQDEQISTAIDRISSLQEGLQEAVATGHRTWGFPKIRGTILGVPIVRTIVFWGLHWGPLILGNYHI